MVRAQHVTVVVGHDGVGRPPGADLAAVDARGDVEGLLRHLLEQDAQRHSRVLNAVHHAVGELAAIELPGCDNRAAMDEVFEGTGYQAEFVHRHHSDVLCVPLEIKKVFMDEASLELKEEVFNVLRQALINALERNYKFFNALNGSSREKR